MPGIAIEKRGEQAPAGIELERVLSSSLSLSLTFSLFERERESKLNKNVPGVNCVTTLRLDDNCRETSFIAMKREGRGGGRGKEGEGGLMNRLECFYLRTVGCLVGIRLHRFAESFLSVLGVFVFHRV